MVKWFDLLTPARSSVSGGAGDCTGGGPLPRVVPQDRKAGQPWAEFCDPFRVGIHGRGSEMAENATNTNHRTASEIGERGRARFQLRQRFNYA